MEYDIFNDERSINLAPICSEDIIGLRGQESEQQGQITRSAAMTGNQAFLVSSIRLANITPGVQPTSQLSSLASPTPP